MSSEDFINGRKSAVAEAVALIEKAAGEQPCDCVEKDEKGFYLNRCYCQNYDDKGRVSSWCADMNTARAVSSIVP